MAPRNSSRFLAFVHRIVTTPALCQRLQPPLHCSSDSSGCKPRPHGAHSAGADGRGGHCTAEKGDVLEAKASRTPQMVPGPFLNPCTRSAPFLPTLPSSLVHQQNLPTHCPALPTDLFPNGPKEGSNSSINDGSSNASWCSVSPCCGPFEALTAYSPGNPPSLLLVGRPLLPTMYRL